jgi:ribosomal 50S subunit-associated protein YjgA (DUF615 family)
MLRLINQVVRKEDLEKVQNVLEKAQNQDAQRRRAGGRFGK